MRITPQTILKKVCRTIDILIDAGAKYEGLFPSLLDLETHDMLVEIPPAIAGQRNGDRSHPGSNLIHDEAVILTMYAFGRVFERSAYTEAADRYLCRFATHCTQTETGIFPWGEHAFWHLTEDRVGNSYVDVADPNRSMDTAIHDHLRSVPVWLWEKLYEFNPTCIKRFSEGLDYHWTAGEGWEYIRHAPIEEKVHPTRDARSCDFPRHSGFYILDWSFAYLKTHRTDFLTQIRRMVDYWWLKRDDDGLLLIESRSPQQAEEFYGVKAPGQTLSLGASLLESANLLEAEEPALASQMRRRASTYIDGFLNAPHDLVKGIFAISWKPGETANVSAMPIWGSRYGLWPASYVALTALCAYQLTNDERLLRWSDAVGRCYLKSAFPEDVAVPAMDAGLGLGLLADLFVITRETRWLDGGIQLAERLIDIYFDHDLPRGAVGIDWYESQMGPSFLLHGLARIALLAQMGEACSLDADYTAR